MSEPFLAEIRLFPYNQVPNGWIRCEGQVLQISSNQALFSLIGTTYGGNGTSTFQLPDLRGRVPVHPSQTTPAGSNGGEEAHTLTINEMPQHSHAVSASAQPPRDVSPAGNSWSANTSFYGPAASIVAMNGGAVSSAGGSQAHNNMQPYLALSFCIATQGIYPSHN